MVGDLGGEPVIAVEGAQEACVKVVFIQIVVKYHFSVQVVVNFSAQAYLVLLEIPLQGAEDTLILPDLAIHPGSRGLDRQVHIHAVDQFNDPRPELGEQRPHFFLESHRKAFFHYFQAAVRDG